MNVLFCSPNPLTKSMGAPKVWIELAEEMRALGCTCDMIGPSEVRADLTDSAREDYDKIYSQSLRLYLRANAARYNIVDYDHTHLPYPRSDFCLQTLFVARSVLMMQHLETIAIPRARGLRGWAGSVIKSHSRRAYVQKLAATADHTMREADLVNVSNDADKIELVKRGFCQNKIITLPYGISQARRPLFDSVVSVRRQSLKVAFVGTFDYRKGAREFPEIARRIADKQPQARFKLLGTKGMFATREAVLAQFPSCLHAKLEVVPTYDPAVLPDLLADCCVGIFPSYFEGFPFGVLEMLAAGVPVIAYDAPGPPMMLPPQYLVPCGNAGAMAAKVVTLLSDAPRLQEAGHWAHQQSQQFSWRDIARATMDVYQEHWKKRQL